MNVAWPRRPPLFLLAIRRSRSLAFILSLCLALVIVSSWPGRSVPSIVLLLPAQEAAASPVTQAWLDAAREEGLLVVSMTDNEFMRFGGDRRHIAGVILPDTVHRQASDLLISQLYDYVHVGGRLFVAFDAAVHALHQHEYLGEEARLSRLVGVRYAMYQSLREKTFANQPVFGSAAAGQQLGLQPGKLDFAHSSLPPLGELTTYGYPHLNHAHYRTQPLQAGANAKILLQSAAADAVVAQHRFGAGEVLFANLALGYLKTRTDGYLLHRLLNHFAVTMLGQPRLAAVPQGQGGLVLNLHIDSNSAQQPLLELEARGWFDNGPFSLHFTAGPDTYITGDGMGLNLDHNAAMRAFVLRQVARGHEIGNHGGWGHNIYGNQATEDNRGTFEPYLALNHQSVSQTMAQPARSYSAPMGNHPQWATRWLEAQGFKAYYFTGDNGLGPTRSYQGGQRPDGQLWTFPISSLHQIATLEELDQATHPRSDEDIARFLEALSQYVAEARVARLFYFHPPAAEQYPHVLDRLAAKVQALASQQRFRWYTMEALADFMSRRELVRWRVSPLGGEGNTQLVAHSTVSLDAMSWIFSIASTSGVEVVQGTAVVRRDDTEWVVTAASGKALVVNITSGKSRTYAGRDIAMQN